MGSGMDTGGKDGTDMTKDPARSRETDPRHRRSFMLHVYFVDGRTLPIIPSSSLILSPDNTRHDM